jgi:hypothetical protein
MIFLVRNTARLAAANSREMEGPLYERRITGAAGFARGVKQKEMSMYFEKPLHCNNCTRWYKKQQGNKFLSWCGRYERTAVRSLCKCIAEHGKEVTVKDPYDVLMENCF